MKRPPESAETSVNLAEPISRLLNMYALAAGAAGVGALALAQPAAARIVYTPAHIKLEFTRNDLDLNHDRLTDFVFGFSTSCDPSRCYYSFNIYGPRNNVNGIAFNGYHLAQALHRGALIGSKRAFFTQVVMARATYRSGKLTESGHWINVTDRYLGLKFLIKGKTHYGWARLNVKVKYPFLMFATLTGYAYETIPNKPIIAGATESSDDKSTGEQPNPASLATPKPQPATLGLLALGSPGLSIWRREEAMGAVQ